VDAAIRAYRKDTVPTEAQALIEDRVMAAVRLMPPPQQDFALRDWLFPGMVIAISMFLLPVLGKGSSFLEMLFGPGYEFSLALVLGLVFTAYSVLFIATHVSELQSFLEKRGLRTR
jgi:hypothetical protein